MKKLVITGDASRAAAIYAIIAANIGQVVTIKDGDRTADQSAKFHAICGDVARQAKWGGKKLTPEQWKVLFVSGHSVATGQGADVVMGLEGEWANLRESTAQMSKSRMASLIEYCQSWCAMSGVEMKQ